MRPNGSFDSLISVTDWAQIRLGADHQISRPVARCRNGVGNIGQLKC
jgi:hypothetical protein